MPRKLAKRSLAAVQKTPRQPPRSEGQRLFQQVQGSLDEIAQQLGTKARQSVANWRDGTVKPTAVIRVRMEDLYDIPARAWGLAPGGLRESEPPVELEPPESIKNPTTLADCMALHALVRRSRTTKGLLPSEVRQLADTEARILALRHRFERESRFLEDEIIREHPKWQAIKAGLAKVIAGCPRCAKAVMDELTRLEM